VIVILIVISHTPTDSHSDTDSHFDLDSVQLELDLVITIRKSNKFNFIQDQVQDTLVFAFCLSTFTFSFLLDIKNE